MIKQILFNYYLERKGLVIIPKEDYEQLSSIAETLASTPSDSPELLRIEQEELLIAIKEAEEALKFLNAAKDKVLTDLALHGGSSTIPELIQEKARLTGEIQSMEKTVYREPSSLGLHSMGVVYYSDRSYPR